MVALPPYLALWDHKFILLCINRWAPFEGGLLSYFSQYTLQRKPKGMWPFHPCHADDSPFFDTCQWDDPLVVTPLVFSVVFALIFFFIELCIAPEPVLPPSLLKQKIPVLVGTSNFLVAICNFSMTYFYPMWFQTVMLTSASTAGTLTPAAITPGNLILMLYRITSITE